MSTKAKALPAGWSKILDDVHARLEGIAQTVNARADNLPANEPETLVAERFQEIAHWNENLDRLSAYLAAAEQVVHSVDEMLLEEESRLRQQLATCETLRQKAGG